MLKAGRLRWIAMTVASAAFAAAGVLIFFEAPGGRVGGIVVFGFFGACTAVAALQRVWRSTLALSPDGFTLKSLGRNFTRRWADIESFVVIRPAAFNEMVGINFRHDGGESRLRSAVRNAAGYEGALPDTFGMKASKLVALLEDWRVRWADVSTSRTSETTASGR